MGAAVPAVLDRFAGVWLVDTEFIAHPGERPSPVCVVGREMRSGREVHLWGDDMRQPLPIGPDDVLVAYSAPAEIGVYLVLGWPMPKNVIDLYVEFRNYVNGRRGVFDVKGSGLLAALAHFGVSAMDPERKAHWRDRILQGPPYDDQDREGILDYCRDDVVALEALLPPLLARLERRPVWLDHALLRGRYAIAVAKMEHAGVPFDMPMFRRLTRHWDEIKAGLVDTIRDRYPVFKGESINQALFERWLAERDIPWPKTETGLLATDEETFKSMVRAYPEVSPIREVSERLGKMRLSDLQVGSDGRNRASLMPFASKSGRNQPSSSRFVFGPSTWVRSLIQPPPGRAIAYIDFTSQELGIAAALSGDVALQRTYQSRDPYMQFGIEAGMAPPGATKATHPEVRGQCKVLMLSMQYGAGLKSISLKLGGPPALARSLFEAHKRTYSTFWAWLERSMDTAMLRGWADTVFGWRLHVTYETKPTSLMNSPMQSNGSEMLRLACTLATEAGIRVAAPVHDALLVEADEGEIEAVVERTRQLMGKASRIVLGGFEIHTDYEIVRHPDRYSDERGVEMWNTVLHQLAGVEARQRVAA